MTTGSTTGTSGSADSVHYLDPVELLKNAKNNFNQPKPTSVEDNESPSSEPAPYHLVETSDDSGDKVMRQSPPPNPTVKDNPRPSKDIKNRVTTEWPLPLADRTVRQAVVTSNQPEPSSSSVERSDNSGSKVMLEQGSSLNSTVEEEVRPRNQPVPASFVEARNKDRDRVMPELGLPSDRDIFEFVIFSEDQEEPDNGQESIDPLFSHKND
ncbi:hypothetical protein PISL3812_08644 [Talaromyces islandicus]|uniref:Uncharacterized protein n=1 Tax=Talaromyces islandicus TaxID=28573 RepID=A0A0U1M7H9_TALIS|nr:hypothetical protein PISL3812_08644 [Talaromyces islandicus]